MNTEIPYGVQWVILRWWEPPTIEVWRRVKAIVKENPQYFNVNENQTKCKI